MTETTTLQAETRPASGTGAARASRREGKTPAIVYGGKKDNVQIVLNENEVISEYYKGHFTSRIVDLEIDGKKERVIARDIQLDPITDLPLHVDFLRLEGVDKVVVQVPVKFINREKSPGIKRGGVLNKVRRDIELICPPDVIPEGVVADLSGLKIRDSIHYSQIEIPEGCVPTITDRDFTIATIAGRIKKEEQVEEAVAIEGAEEVEEDEEGAEE